MVVSLVVAGKGMTMSVLDCVGNNSGDIVEGGAGVMVIVWCCR